MLYNAPSGSSDANASFVGKDVAAGRQGSRVPPMGVEGPQREIVAVIAAAQAMGLDAPSNGDMKQMLKALRSGLLNRFPATGTPDAIVIAPQPVYVALVEGMRFKFKVPGANVSNTTTAPTFAVNGIAPVAIKTRSGLSPAKGDLVGGNVLEAEIWADGTARLVSPVGSDAIPQAALGAARVPFNYQASIVATRTNASASTTSLQIPVMSNLLYPKKSSSSNIVVTLGFQSFAPVQSGVGNGAATARLVTSAGPGADFGINSTFLQSNGSIGGSGTNTPTLVLSNVPAGSIGLGLTYRRDDNLPWNTIFNPNASDAPGSNPSPVSYVFIYEYEPGT